MITATQLRAFGIRSLDEAFNYISQAVHSEPGQQTADIGARGVTFANDLGSHILLVVDGHVVNSATSGEAYFERTAGIPIATIDRIELIYGAGSVLYGNNAMVLVVNVIMKEGADARGVDFQFDGAIAPATNRYGNFDEFDRSRLGHRQEIVARYGDSFKIGKYTSDLIFTAGFLNDQRPKAEMGPQYNDDLRDLFDFGDTGSGDPTVWGGYAGTKTVGPYAYLRWRVGKFTLSGRASHITLTGPGSSFTFDEFDGNRAVSYLDARRDYIVSSKVSGFVRLYGDHFLSGGFAPVRTPFFCSPTPAPCSARFATEEYRGGLENQWSFDWFADARYVTMIGVDARVIGTLSRSTLQDNIGNITAPLSTLEDEVGASIGAYAQQLMRVHPKVSLNVGARYDYFLERQAVSPRGAANFTPWNGGTLKLIYSQAFRAPSVSERADNPDLESEVVRGGELVIGHAKGGHRVSISGFGSIWEDPIRDTIFTDTMSGDFGAVNNTDNLLQAGGTVSYNATLGKFSYGLNGTYAWVRARLGGLSGGDITLTDEELALQASTREAADEFGRNQPLDASPSFFGNFRLAYAIGPELPTLALAGYLQGPRFIRDVYTDPTRAAFVADDPEAAKVPTMFTGRAVVSQEFERFTWGSVGYRLAVEASSTHQTANTVGPFGVFTRDNNMTQQFELNQVARLTVFGGFHINFGRRGGQ